MYGRRYHNSCGCIHAALHQVACILTSPRLGGADTAQQQCPGPCCAYHHQQQPHMMPARHPASQNVYEHLSQNVYEHLSQPTSVTPPLSPVTVPLTSCTSPAAPKLCITPTHHNTRPPRNTPCCLPIKKSTSPCAQLLLQQPRAGHSQSSQSWWCVLTASRALQLLKQTAKVIVAVAAVPAAAPPAALAFLLAAVQTLPVAA